ncbi:copper resistance protein CopC [Brevibacillus ruminantium]|uniref:Copper resistance protein CopC n=1 Tax=Brevibacillus ruminantium TaxID=2950604 RepID=A0ABY4WDT8_9BACL|nr:copper resistance protein CopC [Brevibacillus ruminantium]USG63940.1 copper resistance protein CopC [Brevibacillus ruminantium]
MKRWLILFCLCLVAASSLPSFASAHAYVDRASPQQEAELQESPKEIRLTFTEEINGKVSSLVLKTEAGKSIPGTLRAEDNRTLVLPVESLQKGIYRVEWQVLSVDTHVTEGSYRFAVGVPLPKIRPAETVSLDDDDPSVADNGPFGAVPDQGQSEAQGNKQAESSPNSIVGGVGSTEKKQSPTTGANQALPTNPSESSTDGKSQSQESAAAEQTKPEQGTGEAVAREGSASLEKADDPAKSANESAEGEDDAAAGEGSPNETLLQAGENVATPSFAGDAEVEIVAESFLPSAVHDHERHEMWNRWLRMIDVLVAAIIGSLVFLKAWGRFVDAYRVTQRLRSGIKWFFWGCFVYFSLSGAARIYLLADMLRLPGGNGESMLLLYLNTMTGAMGILRPLLCILLLVALTTKKSRLGSIVLTLGLFITYPLTGHAMAGQERFASFLSDILHMTAAVVWLGGLSGLTLLAFRQRATPDGLLRLHHLMGQFAQLALYAVSLISGTGLVLGLLRFSQLLELISTSYGLILLVKLGAFAVALIVAGFHRSKVMPRLVVLSVLQERDAIRLVKKLSWTLRSELLIVLAALLLAGLLSATPPPIIR